MSPDRWQRLKEVFQSAAELPTLERGSFLDSACSGDPDLRREVELLLSSADGTGHAVDGAVRQAVESIAEVEPRIGAYELLALLGQGGMGSVYLAQRADDAYAKQVAIKVIRGGILAPEWIERFRIERQILARLEHPYIARLLDGGTTAAGAPYVVMEYVQAQPIDQFCDGGGLSPTSGWSSSNGCATASRTCTAI
jgi:serine/threonine protein kinase